MNFRWELTSPFMGSCNGVRRCADPDMLGSSRSTPYRVSWYGVTTLLYTCNISMIHCNTYGRPSLTYFIPVTHLCSSYRCWQREERTSSRCRMHLAEQCWSTSCVLCVHRCVANFLDTKFSVFSLVVVRRAAVVVWRQLWWWRRGTY